MKAITFLGAAEAHETTYIMPDGREHAAPYFGVALARFNPGADMKVFVTDKAREIHWDSFQRLAEDYVDNLEAVEIPDGADENELWSLFQTVVDAVNVQEEVIFDITHGYRSLPFLSLLAVAYLRQIKQIELRAILYGNFEARDRSVEPHRTPVIDLSGFVSLFDWMTAADRFIRFGDASDLARHLRAEKPDQIQADNPLPQVITVDMLRRSGPERKPDPQPGQQANRLARVANSMERVSHALRLIRPNEAMDASARLDRELSDPLALYSIKANAPPFLLLAGPIREAYQQLAILSSQQREMPALALQHERDMIGWLLKRKQYAQAVAIAREWTISWVLLQTGASDFEDRECRQSASDILLDSALRPDIDQLEMAREIHEELRKVRNDLLHAGKNSGALRAQEMEKELMKVCPRLFELKLPT
ncbi:MAG: TIGR02221 family CRISPR-associated protein [Chloroflexi bacterium]|nr:TIGR02221 family CRISPR-associated protein [Chloroflexota bacterium]